MAPGPEPGFIPIGVHPTATQVRLVEGEGLSGLQALSPDSRGLIFTQRAGEGGERHLMWLRPGGKLQPLVPKFFASSDPEVSFDAKRLLFAGKSIVAAEIFHKPVPFEPENIYGLVCQSFKSLPASG